MRRLFLSAPTTCALLLGTGLLLRAQAVLRSEPPATQESRVVEKSARAEPPEQEQQAASAQVGRSKQALLRRGTDGVWRVDRRSQSGNAQAPRGRHGKRTGHRPARRTVVVPRPMSGGG